jgi:hypothetical protein
MSCLAVRYGSSVRQAAGQRHVLGCVVREFGEAGCSATSGRDWLCCTGARLGTLLGNVMSCLPVRYGS